MIKVKSWTPKEAQQELSKRLTNARNYRKHFNDIWRENEQVTYSTRGDYEGANGYNLNNATTQYDTGRGDASNPDVDINVSYIQKNVNFLQAQMSANPPSVAARATSSDVSDRRKADAADRLCKHALRGYDLQEVMDKAALSCIVYGTGFLKTIWDSSKGEILEYDEETGEAILEGDISITHPSTWDVFLDPDAECWEDVRYVFHRMMIPLEEALYRFPEHAEYFKKSVSTHRGQYDSQRSTMNDNKFEVVEIFEYWEKGLPYNGYVGRYAVCDGTGRLLSEVRDNPHAFVSSGSVGEIQNRDDLTDEQKEVLIARLPVKAELPFHHFSYLDMPNNVYGRSVVSYAAHLQQNINSLDGMNLDSVAVNGIPRMVLPEGSEISDDALTNSPVEVIKISGAQPPFNIQPGNVSNDTHILRDRFKSGIDEVFGVNESMFGQMNRETAGTTMQYATNQGNMLRRRVFNKYVLFTESVYKAYLNLIRKHWTTAKTITVLGKEKELEAYEIKGADIDGGYDLVVEYGSSFSLDPVTRREEIMMMMPVLKEAGVPAQEIVKKLRLNDIDGLVDAVGIAETRQAEIFERIVQDQVVIRPERYQDHTNMIAYAFKWFMTKEFTTLPSEIQELCRLHIDLRKERAASEAGPPQQAGPAGKVPPTPAPSGPGASAVPGSAGLQVPRL